MSVKVARFYCKQRVVFVVFKVSYGDDICSYLFPLLLVLFRCIIQASGRRTIVLKRQHNSSIQFYFFISFCVTLSFFYNTNYFFLYESDMRHFSCIFLKKHSPELCLKIKSSKFRRIQKHRHTFHETYCFGPNIFWADIGPKHEKQ